MKRFIILFTLIILGISSIIFVCLKDNNKNNPNLQSVVDLGGDIARNFHRVGMTLSRVKSSEEITLGKKLAQDLEQRVRLFNCPERQDYVQKVGNKVAEGRKRKDISYRFQIIDSGQENAFALPGGYIYITTRMLAFLQSEAELAFILGHEIAHVDQHHAIEQYQYQMNLEKIGLDDLEKIITGLQYLSALSYSEQQEHEADFQGIRLMALANYKPQSSVEIFERMKAIEEDTVQKAKPNIAKDPIEETADVLEGAIKSYFETHPSFERRIYEMERYIQSTGIKSLGRI
ncbi:MAG: M48 family metalloprotease [bacterium]